jgi:hypothetical protein
VVVAAEAKAEIVKEHRKAVHLLASARRLRGQTTRLLRKPRRCRRVTVPITMRTLAITKTPGIIKRLRRLASGSRTIDRRHSRSSGRRNRSTTRRNLSTGSRHHNM